MIPLQTPILGSSFSLPACKNVIVILVQRMGEALLAGPLLHGLRHRFPQATIRVVARKHAVPILKRHPAIDQVLPLPDSVDAAYSRSSILANIGQMGSYFRELLNAGADLALVPSFRRDILSDAVALSTDAPICLTWNGDTDAESSAETQERIYFYTHMLSGKEAPYSEGDRYEHFGKSLGLQLPASPMQLTLSSEDYVAADRLLKEHGLDPEKTIVVFGSQLTSTLAPSLLSRLLEGALVDASWNVLLLGEMLESRLFGASFEGSKFRVIQGFGRLDWVQTGALLTRVRLSVGPEGDWAHLACTMNAKHVVLMGGGTFAREFPYSRFTTLVCRPVECYFCEWKCRYNRLHCLENLRPEAIRTAIELSLNSIAERPRLVIDLGPKIMPTEPSPLDLIPMLNAEEVEWITVQ